MEKNPWERRISDPECKGQINDAHSSAVQEWPFETEPTYNTSGTEMEGATSLISLTHSNDHDSDSDKSVCTSYSDSDAPSNGESEQNETEHPPPVQYFRRTSHHLMCTAPPPADSDTTHTDHQQVPPLGGRKTLYENVSMSEVDGSSLCVENPRKHTANKQSDGSTYELGTDSFTVSHQSVDLSEAQSIDDNYPINATTPSVSDSDVKDTYTCMLSPNVSKFNDANQPTGAGTNYMYDEDRQGTIESDIIEHSDREDYINARDIINYNAESHASPSSCPMTEGCNDEGTGLSQTQLKNEFDDQTDHQGAPQGTKTLFYVNVNISETRGASLIIKDNKSATQECDELTDENVQDQHVLESEQESCDISIVQTDREYELGGQKSQSCDHKRMPQVLPQHYANVTILEDNGPPLLSSEYSHTIAAIQPCDCSTDELEHQISDDCCQVQHNTTTTTRESGKESCDVPIANVDQSKRQNSSRYENVEIQFGTRSESLLAPFKYLYDTSNGTRVVGNEYITIPKEQ